MRTQGRKERKEEGEGGGGGEGKGRLFFVLRSHISGGGARSAFTKVIFTTEWRIYNKMANLRTKTTDCFEDEEEIFFLSNMLQCQRLYTSKAIYAK